jgi:glucuronosyltransferase
VENGIAIKVSFQTMTVDKLHDALTKILHDPNYRERMKVVSARLRDQPEKPIDRAVWWVEWALRNPKPDHLVSPTMRLGSFRANLYDIHVLVIVLLGLMVYYARSFINGFRKKTLDEKRKLRKASKKDQ